MPTSQTTAAICFVLAFIAACTGSIRTMGQGFNLDPFAEAAVGLADQPACDALPVDSCDRFLMRSLHGTAIGSLLQSNRMTISGWTEGAFTASSVSSNQLPMGFNYRANEFLLQQNWLRVERTLEAGADEPSFGLLADTILPGSDYRFTLARGLADDQTATHGFDPVQVYMQLYFPGVAQGLEIKAGRFFGQYGVESIAGAETPFVSRAYNFIYNPFTHTGLLTTLQLNDNWSLQNGIVAGSDVFFDSASEPTYIGSVKWESDDQKTSLLFATILGSGRFNEVEDFSNPRVFDMFFTRQLSEELTYKLDALYGYQTDVPTIGTAQWYAFVNYLTYQASPNWSATTRLEFFDDVDGDRTGFDGLYTAVTAGITYQPRPSMMLRPEIRFDHNDSSRPFEGRSGLFTAACGVTLLW
jgi:hypothetical protein